MKKLLLVSLFVGVITVVFAQQDPQFSQNMFNRLQPNPATAGSNDAICAHLLYRSQWVSFDGAPKTGVLSIDAPVSFLHGGLGLTLMNDKIGFEKSFNAKLAYALRFDVGVGKIAIGADVGLMQKSLEGGYVYDNSGVYNPKDLDDPLIPKNNVSGSAIDLGLGAYYNSEHFYAGVSALHLTEAKIDYGNQSSKLARHLYGMVGASFDLTPSVALKPSVFVKNIPAKTIADINLNVHFSNTFYVGASYRLEDAIVAMAGVNLFQNLRLGYSYDITTSRLKDFNNGSHEIFLGYCYKIRKKQPSSVKNVRFL
ncbi:MAG: type IX secretion system membrane protein PorP/SprF [Bacteroidia bacterium]|nr:type IX secretion system membrane protein PorP/SprF [Bacteroidia bacterium]MCZ2276735.1 type IX secretion system membrane protein PorP/SprF [Bacteroidia bacterium]